MPAAPPVPTAWNRPRRGPSLPEVNGSIAVPQGQSFWRKFAAFAGPGFVISVGYMDPGNWATDLSAGAQYGYRLLVVVVVANLMAILLQHLALKLGIVTGRDLAQACRDHYSRATTIFLWFLCELAIAACDLAEVVGMAIGLQLLFGLPLIVGCIITCLDVLAILYLQNRGFRYLEALILVLIVCIAGCFALEIALARPSLLGMLAGLTPSPEILREPGMLYLAIGILGATVMPHNLYLHSSIIQTRRIEPTSSARREAIRFGTLDSTLALVGATFVNAAILVLAAATFHFTGHREVADIQGAYKLLTPLLGVGAGGVFACGLLASGQNSTLTGTLAGQIVMQGFLDIQLKPWLSRLLTRSIAIVPAVIVIGFYGEDKTNDLIVASQVALSLQLGFAVWPLMRFTSDRAKMGEFVNSWWIKILGWAVTLLIIGLNAKLAFDVLSGTIGLAQVSPRS